MELKPAYHPNGKSRTEIVLETPDELTAFAQYGLGAMGNNRLTQGFYVLKAAFLPVDNPYATPYSHIVYTRKLAELAMCLSDPKDTGQVAGLGGELESQDHIIRRTARCMGRQIKSYITPL